MDINFTDTENIKQICFESRLRVFSEDELFIEIYTFS